MTNADSRVTIHMAASLDGFIARRDGTVDFLETADHFEGGDALSAEAIASFFETVDCYVMGARTYETGIDFESKGFGWPYGDKPVIVLTHRELPATRGTIEFYAGDLQQLVEQLRERFRNIWIAGGGILAAECLRRGLADEVLYAMVPVVIGDGIRFFENLDRDVPMHLMEVKAYQSGIVMLRYEVRRS